MERWIQLRRYELLGSSEETDTGDAPQVRLGKWLALRRVRTILCVGVLLLAVTTSIHFIDASTISRAVHHATSESLPTNTTESTAKTNDQVNWSDYAYVQYVTNENYLCNSLMILESLHRLKSKADRIMMYPKEWQLAGSSPTAASNHLIQARDQYHTKLIPITVQHSTKGDPTWQDSFTKLLAFNQTQYKRLISLDSDATHMDELFLTPLGSSPVAMPRAYWLDQPFLSSQIILLAPSATEWGRVQRFIDQKDSGFDMDILNTLYRDSCIVLPHRPYNLITAEFRAGAGNHAKYLGSEEARWNASAVLNEAKFVHFSDWPLPKPWIKAADGVVAETVPKCTGGQNGEGMECADRDVWMGLYRDFSERRQRVCGRHYDKGRARRRDVESDKGAERMNV
ncbi:nucleotide-diphospho-sugar transferase [Bimuria novae-zelandiae CBS 107.79]|uniref:Nucleotide-diphospho-sugar transferase n=1 Tax=Bimuria novae-zelandiae CBS 107.79 TaxID=1447943 RepID=A0A6A5UXP3_9PLEO|nr:nucleotide-diphospho-sugar transferase [Bimuria novae-zelandiae CBS 107.79]